jgi:hypothetical protein
LQRRCCRAGTSGLCVSRWRGDRARRRRRLPCREIQLFAPAAFTALTWPWRSGRGPGATHLGLLATLPRVSHRAAQRPPKVLSPVTHLSRCTDSCTAYAREKGSPAVPAAGEFAPGRSADPSALPELTPLYYPATTSTERLPQPLARNCGKPTLAATRTRTARDARRRVVQESTGNSYKSRGKSLGNSLKKQGQESPTDNSYSQY